MFQTRWSLIRLSAKWAAANVGVPTYWGIRWLLPLMSCHPRHFQQSRIVEFVHEIIVGQRVFHVNNRNVYLVQWSWPEFAGPLESKIENHPYMWYMYFVFCLTVSVVSNLTSKFAPVFQTRVILWCNTCVIYDSSLHLIDMFSKQKFYIVYNINMYILCCGSGPLIWTAHRVRTLGTTSKVQRLQKRKLTAKGGGRVESPCLTFFDVSETLRFSCHKVVCLWQDTCFGYLKLYISVILSYHTVNDFTDSSCQQLIN